MHIRLELYYVQINDTVYTTHLIEPSQGQTTLNWIKRQIQKDVNVVIANEHDWKRWSNGLSHNCEPSMNCQCLQS